MLGIKKKMLQWIIVSLFFLLIAGLVTYGYILIYKNLNKTYVPIKKNPSYITETENNDKSENELINEAKAYLILGVDSSQDDIGRTDCIIIVTINDVEKKITMLSIPRDTYVELAGRGYKDKINHAYQFGIETTIATVENFLEIPINNYILFTFDGYVKAVDAIGGVIVDIDQNIAKASERELSFENRLYEGKMLLNGFQALYYARFRSDINGDYGRNDRQQEVLKAFLNQSKSLTSAKRIINLIEVIGNDVQTNITLNEMFNLAVLLKNYSSSNIEKIKYTGHSERFGEENLWYVIITEEERKRVANILKDNLNF